MDGLDDSPRPRTSFKALSRHFVSRHARHLPVKDHRVLDGTADASAKRLSKSNLHPSPFHTHLRTDVDHH
jgi:hypothetical protein